MNTTTRTTFLLLGLGAVTFLAGHPVTSPVGGAPGTWSYVSLLGRFGLGVLASGAAAFANGLAGRARGLARASAVLLGLLVASDRLDGR